ncbi:Alkylhydroperoxidase family enzyme, contains CxxC motif [Lentzea fradiae]|uniref:Alkylhydroperoxidase family enzyme, contains CxxC motif n=1 Tax=Lentzea fradiae TaxID=200378 RepID=A0A1G8BW19_9PSEU|nr:carboxymuconolactone decarboxylase family protein [Lentzea fradiae]SDH37249.1 Alkylhydroperoxidase family enzyme, contains CxxC motif [Lentzea fradiae]
MTRIKGVPAKDTGLLTKALYWFARREFGAVPEPVTVMAHHPRLTLASGRHELAVKKAVKGSAHGPLFELCVYRTAVTLGCSWCVDFGAMLMKHEGLDVERLRHIDSYATSELFTDLERKALAYADAMTGTPVTVTDEQVAELERLLGREELVALTYQIALENQRARFNSAFDIKDQGFASGDACRVPAP